MSVILLTKFEVA